MHPSSLCSLCEQWNSLRQKKGIPFFFFFLFKPKKDPDFALNVHPDFRLKMDKGITANVDSLNTRRVGKRDLVDWRGEESDAACLFEWGD